MYAVVCGVAMVAALLTFFSGFGLNTLLMPVLAVFFPIELAIAAAAVVHLANSLFKLAIVFKWADWPTVARFGIPSAAGALVGAWLLSKMSTGHVIATYLLGGHECRVTYTGVVLGALIGFFALLEFSSVLEKAQLSARLMPLGGLLSGFFGGLSGHQGALRSAFLVRSGLGKQAMVGTRAACAVIVDISRLAVYGMTFSSREWDTLREKGGVGLIAAATFAAFVGTFAGSRLLKSVTLEGLQRFIAIMLLLFAATLIAGIV